MAEASWYHSLAFKVKSYPWLHGILKQVRRFFNQVIRPRWFDFIRVIAPLRSFRFGPPVGSYSIYAAWRQDPPRPERVAVTDQGTPDVPSNSLLDQCGMSQHLSQPWPVFWSRHKSARLVSSSLALLDEQKRICREAVYGDLCIKDDPGWNYTMLPRPVELSGNWTSLISRWVPNGGVPTFSHWILDALPRLGFLSEFPSDTRILVPSRLAGYQKETLSLLGLMDRCRYTPETHVVVENYYFSTPTAMISCHNPYGVNVLRSLYLPKADTSYQGPKRFIIARKGKTRGIKNEAEVYDFFRGLGWEIIDTEKLTFAQEIQLFSQAEAYAGILGSGFTNGIWSSPGCKVLTFVASNWLDGWVEWICKVNQLDYCWRTFPADESMVATVDLGEVKRMLEQVRL
jgi:hypothetical protein